MAGRVPSQRYNQDVGRQTDQIAHAAKAKPALPVESIGLPGNRTIPLHRLIPPAIECAITLPRSGEFGVEHMHGSPGKVLDPAGMVEIEMGHNDVAHILGGKPAGFDLTPGRILLAQPDAIGEPEKGA